MLFCYEAARHLELFSPTMVCIDPPHRRRQQVAAPAELLKPVGGDDGPDPFAEHQVSAFRFPNGAVSDLAQGAVF
jgi:hypothetical protein